MTATRFTQAQVRRAVKGAMDGGMKVGCVEVTPEGVIRLLPESPKSRQQSEIDEFFEEDDGEN